MLQALKTGLIHFIFKREHMHTANTKAKALIHFFQIYSPQSYPQICNYMPANAHKHKKHTVASIKLYSFISITFDPPFNAETVSKEKEKKRKKKINLLHC